MGKEEFQKWWSVTYFVTNVMTYLSKDGKVCFKLKLTKEWLLLSEISKCVIVACYDYMWWLVPIY